MYCIVLIHNAASLGLGIEGE